jgi:hypothetical protein
MKLIVKITSMADILGAKSTLQTSQPHSERHCVHVNIAGYWLMRCNTLSIGFLIPKNWHQYLDLAASSFSNISG